MCNSRARTHVNMMVIMMVPTLKMTCRIYMVLLLAIIIVETTTIASIFSLLCIAFLVSAYIIPDFLVLLKQEPEHAI